MTEGTPITTGVLLTCLLVLTGGWLSGPSVLAQDPPTKVVVVDLERVVTESDKGEELQSRLEQFQQATQTEGAALADEARSLRQKIVDGANSLSDEKLSELQKQYEDSNIAIKRFQDDKQREGQKIQAEGLREIEKQLQPVFEKVRDEYGLDLIINDVAGVVVMANPKVDITQLVIEQLNAAQVDPGM